MCYRRASHMPDLLFPTNVLVRRVEITAGQAMPLFPAEEMAIERAVDRRKREFAAGRACARDALGELGIAPCSIPVGDYGMPVWPAGVVGSITHEGDVACAAVALSQEYASIGIDLAYAGSVTADLASLIFGSEEADLPSCLPSTIDRLSLLFSAKESVYKCFYPLVRKFIEFHDALILWDCPEDSPHGQFRVMFSAPDYNHFPGAQIVGRWMIDRRHIYTSAFVRSACAIPARVSHDCLD